MRFLVLMVAVVFIALLAYLTVTGFLRQGTTAAGVLGALIVAVLAVGIVGALRHHPPQR